MPAVIQVATLGGGLFPPFFPGASAYPGSLQIPTIGATVVPANSGDFPGPQNFPPHFVGQGTQIIASPVTSAVITTTTP